MDLLNFPSLLALNHMCCPLHWSSQNRQSQRIGSCLVSAWPRRRAPTAGSNAQAGRTVAGAGSLPMTSESSGRAAAKAGAHRARLQIGLRPRADPACRLRKNACAPRNLCLRVSRQNLQLQRTLRDYLVQPPCFPEQVAEAQRGEGICSLSLGMSMTQPPPAGSA